MHQSFETPRHENATTELNVNRPIIHEEVSLIFRWLEVIRSLPPPGEFEKLNVHPAPQGNTSW